jgi:hypothetical protein
VRLRIESDLVMIGGWGWIFERGPGGRGCGLRPRTKDSGSRLAGRESRHE